MHTPGPWRVTESTQDGFAFHIEGVDFRVASILSDGRLNAGTALSNAILVSAAQDMLAEMQRYLPIIERAESDPTLWAKLTAMTGIATGNRYRRAIAKATGKL